MLNKNMIKEKAWEGIKDYIKLNDDEFNQSACSFKISKDFNLVIWCDIDYEYDKENPKYFLISIRYNPHDELFGDDISNLEWSTRDLSKEGLNKGIDILTDSLQGKKLVKNQYNSYELTTR